VLLAQAAQVHVPEFVVIGGGDIGVVHVRQLLRAVAAGRLETRSIRVVDRDPDCPVRRFADPRVRLETADWGEWLDVHLHRLDPDAHFVPYHWAPHLLREWLERRVAASGVRTRRGAPMPSLGLPFEASAPGGDRALSYASWTCPPLCIEPDMCPHTRGPKSWSLAADLAALRPSGALVGRIVFRCHHLVYGVGTIPVADILAAEERLARAPSEGDWLVATSSHCHALASSLRVLD
jgi:hypothetical protein